MNCACQVQSTNNEMPPTSIAARPSHSMNTPGATTSSTSSKPPAMNQSQTPSEASSVSMEIPQLMGFAPAAGTVGRGGCAPLPELPPPKVSLAISAMPPSEPS